ncbi:uncharacterized protein LOC123548064 [Mercenaria mercenaria]|uniref:uncharacterized protein LOC123548064 n=1 Tax=Mercenaria mercenaria TaxID=6596 RepID=UPI00234EC79B|nr:uncharacterized protein LOC123548064 [Mercenaria mercenaria]XP_045191229.2 uncharacterized protein LOC123548064 [Mercenaria mercenaria]XP_045191230.2 uncharacterized protein LOC123548064 [Mercenaria mercenaria]XP_045191231.2 uncharacterized protein LOC123548064 [Mercenaria mercenaria]
MADEQKHKESPRKLSHLQVARKLSRGADDIFDTDEYANEYYNYQDRRSSSQSISRYNSCPQLLDQEPETRNESYEQTTDDINTGSSVPYLERQCVFVQGPSPVLQRKLYVENGQVSETPTPPSTPKSRRSGFSSRESLLSSPDKTFTSPFTSPRLLLRKQLIQSALSRDSSIDSLTDKSVGEPDKKVPLSVENLNRFDDLKSKDEALKSPKEEKGKVHKVRGRRSIQPEVSDTVNKCENWLQTLQIVQTDRIKSRSNIQLPPI